MPDRHLFDHLPGVMPTVRCVDCPEGGPLYLWPEPLRERHARLHRVERQARAVESRGQLAVLVAGEDVAE